VDQKSLEQRIALIEARDAIRELRARYGWHAARGDFAGVAGLFAPDGVFEFSMPSGRQRLSSRAAISAALSGLFKPVAVMPMIHNEIINVDGDQAWGTCAMESRVAPNYDGGFVGYYHDRARRFDDGWLFTERRWFLYSPVFEDSFLGPDGAPR
jgi:hypothetical protein